MVEIVFLLVVFAFETGSEYIALGLRLELILLFLLSGCGD